MRNFCFLGFSSSLLKYKKKLLEKIYRFFKRWARKFHFSKYMNFFQSWFFCFLSSESSSWKYNKFLKKFHYNKSFFWENIYKRINLRARKFHFPKCKKNFFLRKYKKFFKSDFFFVFYDCVEKWPIEP